MSKSPGDFKLRLTCRVILRVQIKNMVYGVLDLKIKWKQLCETLNSFRTSSFSVNLVEKTQ